MLVILFEFENVCVLCFVSKVECDGVVEVLKVYVVVECFKGKLGEIVMLFLGEVFVLFGIGDGKSEFVFGVVVFVLFEGDWWIENLLDGWDVEFVVVVWCMGVYRFI